MEFKGTKGEWEILLEDNYGIYIGSETTEGNAIVKCFKNNPHLNYSEAKANAQLIASAPKLLEALQDLMNCFPVPPTHNDGTGRIGFGDPLVSSWIRAEEVIKTILSDDL